MMRIQVLFCLLVLVAAQSGRCVDLSKIDRSIGKEPKYTSTPRYALLALGEKADSKVWIVVDGERMYVDRNGNGDLTDEGESVVSVSRYGSSFSVSDIKETASGKQHNNLIVKMYDDVRFRLSIDLAKGCKQTVGFGKSDYLKPQLAAQPKDAPIIHLNGPMTFAPYGPLTLLPRSLEEKSYRLTWMRVFIGSPGLGEGTFAGYNCRAVRCDTGYRNVTADITFTKSDNEKATFTSRQQLEVKG